MNEMSKNSVIAKELRHEITIKDLSEFEKYIKEIGWEKGKIGLTYGSFEDFYKEKYPNKKIDMQGIPEDPLDSIRIPLKPMYSIINHPKEFNIWGQKMYIHTMNLLKKVFFIEGSFQDYDSLDMLNKKIEKVFSENREILLEIAKRIIFESGFSPRRFLKGYIIVTARETLKEKYKDLEKYINKYEIISIIEEGTSIEYKEKIKNGEIDLETEKIKMQMFVDYLKIVFEEIKFLTEDYF